MPELPEVFTLVNNLKNHLHCATIGYIETSLHGLRQLKNFKNHLYQFTHTPLNLGIKSVFQHGKYIFIVLDRDFVIVNHLGMSGTWSLKPSNLQHAHITLHLTQHTKNYNLYYVDPRRFGMFLMIQKNLLALFIKLLGPHALSLKNKKHSPIKQSIQGLKKPIKSILLDQKIIAGLGNIYAAEILYLSKIHPLTLGINLTSSQIELIIKNIYRVLNLSIAHGGCTVFSYRSMQGVGNFKKFLTIYNKKFCPQGHQVSNIIINQRSTHVCIYCQKLP